MITKVNAYHFSDEPMDFYGLSTDAKPEDCPNGSRFIEMDTSKIYLYDVAGRTWHEWGGEGE